MACSALYRQSKLGLSLVDALDQLVEEGKLPPQLALRILDEVCRPLHRPLAPQAAPRRALGGTASAIAGAATQQRPGRVASAAWRPLPPPSPGGTSSCPTLPLSSPCAV